jgi:uncharacterized protein YukE
MAGFSADQGALHRASGEHVATAQDVQSTTNLMIAELELMVWKGAGATAFEQAKDALRADLEAISVAIGNLGDRVGAASVKYSHADDEAHSTVTRAGGSFGQIGSQLRGHTV